MADMESPSAHLKSQIKVLTQEWEGASSALAPNPAAYQPYLQNITLVQIDEVIATIADLMGRVKAPHGFSPMFHLARAVAASAVPLAISNAQALQRLEYKLFPNFLLSINQVTSALHSLTALGDQDERRQSIASLGASLSESLSLLDTAQRELAEKHKTLSAADDLVAKLTSAVEGSAVAQKVIEDAANAVALSQARAEDTAKALEALAKRVEGDSDKVAHTRGTSEKLQQDLLDQDRKLSDLLLETKRQSELIASLLPKGASAGLASAFASRGAKLELTKWLWAAGFLFSLGTLVVLGAGIREEIATLTAQQLIAFLLHRLPIAGPLIWLAWFSAIQYGNTLRVQEDYAFKEATSKAFAGYRDHMEHLASVKLEEGKTAMTLMAAKTIEILAREPLRIFGKTDKEASPATSILDGLRSKKPGKTESE